MIYKVTKIVAGIYTLQNNQDEILNIPAAGKLRYQNQTPIVGDNVLVENNQLKEILERKNEFIRPKVANIDQMIVVMSVKDPQFQFFLVDKYLAIIEFKKIKPVIFLTKADLDSEYSRKIYEYYSNMGYKVFLIDNLKPSSYINEVKQIFKDKYSVFMGQSGVGKTTTINNLGQFSFDTQEISKALGRGKHTTRVVSIIPFNDGYFIDTPGFSSLNLDLTAVELAQSFETFYELSKLCKFRNCLHISEKVQDCAIKQQINTKLVPLKRYENYVKLNQEINENKRGF
ncbi:ribosome small subunit-dependent GTPase A [Mycoplasma sp. 888]|uniref:ribosome small subunit-dependent GTPase A n=1 Tax=Mycoplasma sp. 888 TaxID=3108483 RepID=UPI002D795BBA|nr:ribosome small subunit-dependent GTPase A [Mycoplasma sp. 888]WRQ25844.1 ribosome small subunit-dependent GTPase A [Mycoplasma sp. 888]